MMPMPKPKQLLGVNKKDKKGRLVSTGQGPETPDEFLAAGVDLEEAGEKWRAGDASKSCRFFMRALDIYDVGLRRYPHVFDLAYNKARLQYDITQQPRLLAELPTPLLELLHSALESHRYVLALKPKDADTLFNTAQVLTSLAEGLLESNSALSSNRDLALARYQEALDLFQVCLSCQERQLHDVQAVAQNFDSTEPQDQAMEWTSDMPKESKNASNEEQWVSVIEPITISTLLDTMTAQIETATAMCTLMASQDSTDYLKFEVFSRSLIECVSKMSRDTERAQEIELTKAYFLSTFADNAFRFGHITLPAYRDQLKSAYDQKYDLSESVRGLCDRADASINFVTTTRSAVDLASQSSSDLLELTSLQWRYLTKALSDLTTAAKLPDARNLAKIHLRRGDAELLRYCLSEAPSLYSQATQNAALLLKNAEVCYRGAAKTAGIGLNKEEELEATTKEAVASMLSGSAGRITELLRQQDRARVVAVIEEMRDDALLDDGQIVLLEQYF